MLRIAVSKAGQRGINRESRKRLPGATLLGGLGLTTGATAVAAKREAVDGQAVGGRRRRLLFPSGLKVLLLVVLLVSGQPIAAQQIIAHRGASHEAPENTLAAFRLAWARGADGIEGDFYLTRDGRIVCIHDSDTERTAGVKLVVRDSTLAELRRLDVGAWKGDRFRGERIPTLKEVLDTVPDGKKIFIEIKCGPEILPRLKQALAASRLQPEQTVVIAFDEKVVVETRRLIPTIKVYWLAGYKRDKQTGRWSPSLEQVLATLRRTRAHGLDTHANPDVVNERFVQALRDGGFEFHAWTINEVSLARRFQTLGVDSITTDRPGWLRKQLAVRSGTAATR
ncbi:MAG: glycerophosphodiester phosphodiesterase [Planctomycetes bacterium]|nr:glycerophosphodiester phosphodiesterase [Planctomycetota bacterium]